VTDGREHLDMRGERPAHPTGRAVLVIAAAVVVLFVLAALSTFGPL